MVKVLTIAGSDSGGCSGIQADLKTFNAFGVFGVSVITSITSQNTMDIYDIYDIPPEQVLNQIRAVCDDMDISATKVGMLSNEGIVLAVSEGILSYRLKNVVVDTVLKSKTGKYLLKYDAVETLKTNLFPLAYLITPNIPEAEILTNRRISSLRDMKEAAKYLMDFGSANVLVKGGHLEGKFAIDILYNGSEFYEFGADKVDYEVRGTGCTHSSAIASMLARGYDLITSIDVAKKYITEAIMNAVSVGKGYRCLNHSALKNFSPL